MAGGQTDPWGAFVAFAERRAAPAGGPLAGLDFAIKDLLEAAGRAPGCGLAEMPGRPPLDDAPLLARLLAAGARFRGFTAMTPLAYEPSGANPVQGRPRNPWSARHVCGGSSSGSAVAVAAGLVDFALGSDTGGSLRIPAHCCGVSAWKPTHGLLPLDGAMPLAPSLDTLGFLAADIDTLARIAAAVGVPAGTPMTSVGVALDVAQACDADILAACERMAAACAPAGLTTAPVMPGPLIAACDAAVLTVMQGEAARMHRARLEAGTLDAVTAARLAKGLAIEDAALDAARATLGQLATEAWPALLGGLDAVLLPVMRIRTPEVAVCEPSSPRFSARTLYHLSALTRWVNGLGLPAVAIPAGLDRDGLPIAMQLVGRRGSDRSLLAAAAALRRAFGPALSPPAPDGRSA